MSTNSFSITDLRQKTTDVLLAAKQMGYVTVVKNSKNDAYVVDPKYFLALQEAYEDYLDILEYDQGIESLKKEKAIKLSEL